MGFGGKITVVGGGCCCINIISFFAKIDIFKWTFRLSHLSLGSNNRFLPNGFYIKRWVSIVGRKKTRVKFL